MVRKLVAIQASMQTQKLQRTALRANMDGCGTTGLVNSCVILIRKVNSYDNDWQRRLQLSTAE